MAKLEIPVKVYFGEIDEIIRELKQLQTYKLFEGAEEVLVDIDDVARVLAGHVKATTAQPEQRWIPCSERLPEPYEYCLWTTIDGRVVYHHCDGLFSKYIAWMPLPEPYKGGIG